LTARFRRSSKVVANAIETANQCAAELYYAVEKTVDKIARIYTDGNSCYSEMFARIGVSALHRIAPGKSQTHLIAKRIPLALGAGTG
jgi:hypothetical protein